MHFIRMLAFVVRAGARQNVEEGGIYKEEI